MVAPTVLHDANERKNGTKLLVRKHSTHKHTCGEAKVHYRCPMLPLPSSCTLDSCTVRSHLGKAPRGTSNRDYRVLIILVCGRFRCLHENIIMQNHFVKASMCPCHPGLWLFQGPAWKHYHAKLFRQSIHVPSSSWFVAVSGACMENYYAKPFCQSIHVHALHIRTRMTGTHGMVWARSGVWEGALRVCSPQCSALFLSVVCCV